MIKCLLLLLCPAAVFAQGLTDISLSSIKSPSSPGFTILGVQPKDVSRPKDFNAFEVSLVNAYSTGNTGTLPVNFAVEVTPYWLKYRSITFKKLEDESGIDKVFCRTFSVSIATAQRTSPVDPTLKISQLGAGFRALLSQGVLAEPVALNAAIAQNTVIEETANLYGILLDGVGEYLEANKKTRPKYTYPDIADLLKSPYTKLKAYATAKDAGLKEVLTQLDADQAHQATAKVLFTALIRPALKNADLVDVDEWTEFIATLEPSFIATLRKNTSWETTAKKIRDFREKRVGLLWEIAGATALESPNARYNTLSARRYGVWTTLTIRPAFTNTIQLKQKLDVALMARYLHDNTEQLVGSNLDLGFRPVYDNNRFVLSGELLWRNTWRVVSNQPTATGREKTIDVQNGFRWGVNAGYRVTSNIMVELNVGKAFDNDGINAGGFLTAFGANFGFGRPVAFLN